MIKINEDERRDFFRIDDEIYLDFEAISEDEYADAPNTLKDLHENAFSLSADFATLNNKTHPLLNNIKQLHPDIGEYLEVLNSKIDSLSQQMLYDNSSFDQDKVNPANLSASGIQFSSSDNFETGQAIKLELVLLPEKIGVLVFGRVVKSSKNHLSVMFEYMRPEDQELMIKHNLNKQMTDLREKKDSE
ncbi:MAG: PilZ domain-containing protein [Gammaproteobacteria bacterium]|nr:PilZ domain-containing protein [Gammaproteobacteria bacterium]